MIDVHCHILPAVDDGVRTMEEALALLRVEAGGGTRTFIATPHYIEEQDLRRAGDIEGRVAELQDAASRAGIEVTIAQGGEIYPTLKALKALDAGAPLTLAQRGKHMLVDLPLTFFPSDFDTFLFEIQARGIIPILAHPERAAVFQESPERLEAYLGRGMACQVNAGSLRGRYGPRAQKVARLVLTRRWASFLASDAHRPGREPGLRAAVDILSRELGTEYLQLLTVDSGRAVLEGAELPARPAPPEKPRAGWLARLRGHRSS